MRLSALLLAAGQSIRMGRPKALLPWQGRTLVEFQIEQLLTGGIEQVILVLGHAAEMIRAVVASSPRTQIVLNQDYASGRASSVRAGMNALDADAVLVLAVDQPRPAELIQQLCAAHATVDALITVPAYDGRHGHPTIFAQSLFPEMRRITEETQGLRAIRHRHRIRTHVIETATRVPLIDLNTPDDYQAALAFFSSVHEDAIEPHE
jgi:molybdenum cofactor cytidylyltransferase